MPDGGFIGGIRAPAPAASGDTVARVGRVAVLLAEMEDPDAALVAEALRLFLRGAPLDGALGLRSGWYERQAEDRRDAALTALSAAQPPDWSYRRRAASIVRAIRLYAPKFEQDHAAGRRPSGPAGHLFDYLESNGPRSDHSIRKALPGLLQTTG